MHSQQNHSSDRYLRCLQHSNGSQVARKVSSRKAIDGSWKIDSLEWFEPLANRWSFDNIMNRLAISGSEQSAMTIAWVASKSISRSRKNQIGKHKKLIQMFLYSHNLQRLWKWPKNKFIRKTTRNVHLRASIEYTFILPDIQQPLSTEFLPVLPFKCVIQTKFGCFFVEPHHFFLFWFSLNEETGFKRFNFEYFRLTESLTQTEEILNMIFLLSSHEFECHFQMLQIYWFFESFFLIDQFLSFIQTIDSLNRNRGFSLIATKY